MLLFVAGMLCGLAVVVLAMVSANRIRRRVSPKYSEQTLQKVANQRVRAMRGPPRELMGTVHEETRWPVASASLREGAKYAAAAITYYVAMGQETTISPEMTAIRFALWWHGLPAECPHPSMQEFWDYATYAPRLGVLASIEQSRVYREEASGTPATLSTSTREQDSS